MSAVERYAIGIVHHGDLTPTLSCLASLRQLTAHPHACLLLWNGASEARLPDALSPYAEVIQPGANLGFAGGANELARIARARGCSLLWLLNNDVTVQAHTAEALLRTLRDAADVAIAGPRILQRDGTIWHDGGTLQWPTARVESPGYGEHPSAAATPHDVDFVCGCAPMIRLSAMEEVDGFDERYFLYYEDVDLSLRLQKAKWRTVHVPGAVISHDGSSAVSAEGPALGRYYRTRNRRLLLASHEQPPIGSLRERFRSWRYRLTGRGREAQAITTALRDAKAEDWGRCKLWS